MKLQQEKEQEKEPEKEPSYRSLEVADMTTFMAKLLQKLTEMSCKLANVCIQESNDFVASA